MPKVSLSCVLQKRYEKACLKNHRTMHTQTRVLAHTRGGLKNLIGYIVGGAQGKAGNRRGGARIG